MFTTRSIAIVVAVALDLAVTSSGAQTPPATSPVPAPPGKIVISGAVPDEATKAALITRLQELYGPGQIVDQISIGGVIAPPTWSAQISKLITPQIKSIGKGQLTVEGTAVSIRGEVANEALRQSIASEFASILNSTYIVKNGLRVTAVSQNVLDQALANRVVEFEHGSAFLTDSGKLILDEMAEALKKVDAKKFEVIGHTDNVGAPARNLMLSRARADSVKTYLVSKGLPPELIATSGMGADQPLVANTSEDNRKRNRRIEFRVSQ
jgi:OOP family OmpA-OmpF porin